MRDARSTLLRLRDGRRPPGFLLIGLFAVLLLLGIAAAADSSWFERPLERYVSWHTGRDFEIRGAFYIDLGRVVTVTGEDLALSNAAWSTQAAMARADRARIAIELWPLLQGRWIVPRVELDRPRLLLERNAAGDANWRFDGRIARRTGRLLQLGDVTVRGGSVRLLDHRQRTDLRLTVESAATREPSAPTALLANGTGHYRYGRFELEGRLDLPSGASQRGGTFGLDLKARAGSTRAHLWGALPAPIDVRMFRLRARVSGDDLADWYPLLGIAVPETPPYELVGDLVRDRNVVRYEDFSGSVGDSDLSGSLGVTLGGERPFASGWVLSRRLDFDDLAGLVGAPPGTQSGEVASAEQRAIARRRAADPKLLPDRPFDLDKLRAADARVAFRAVEVDAGKLPIASIAAELRLEDGVVRVEPLDVEVAGGHVTGRIRMDAADRRIATSIDLDIRDVELARLFPRAVPDSVGLIAADVQLSGEGNTVARMLATADGEFDAVMGRGRFSNLLLELAGLDVAESLRFLLDRDRTVPLRCAYARFEVVDGVMRSKALVFDTADTVVFGDGKLDLRREQLDLELRLRPKDWSLVSLRAPLEVRGTFKDPSIAPKPGPLAARVALAAALYAVAPPAALLALIETGPGDDARCGGTLPGRRNQAGERTG